VIGLLRGCRGDRRSPQGPARRATRRWSARRRRMCLGYRRSKASATSFARASSRPARRETVASRLASEAAASIAAACTLGGGAGASACRSSDAAELVLRNGSSLRGFAPTAPPEGSTRSATRRCLDGDEGRFSRRSGRCCVLTLVRRARWDPWLRSSSPSACSRPGQLRAWPDAVNRATSQTSRCANRKRTDRHETRANAVAGEQPPDLRDSRGPEIPRAEPQQPTRPPGQERPTP